jgi:hypothetical protein
MHRPVEQAGIAMPAPRLTANLKERSHTMSNTATKLYDVGVIERAIAYYEVWAEDARAAAENWQDGEFSDRDDEALDSEGPCVVREREPDGTWRKVLPAEWENTDPDLPSRFDDYEIHGMKPLPAIHGQEEEPVGRTIDNCEQVPDEEATFWTLFGRIPGQGLDCVGDFKTREHAEEVYARITGRCYGSPS